MSALAIEGRPHSDKAIDAVVAAIREGLPAVAPFQLWRQQEITDGAVERRFALPLLVLTRNALWLIHFESRPGSVAGEGDLWRWTPRDTPNVVRTIDPPDALLARTAERLKDALLGAHADEAVPRLVPVRTAIVVVGVSELGGTLKGREDLFAVDAPVLAGDAELVRLINTLTAPPAEPLAFVRTQDAAKITAALRRNGMTDSALRQVKGFQLGALLEDHNTWQEHHAVHAQDPSRTARVRTWILPRAESDQQRRTLGRAVTIASRVLQQVGAHPNILGLIDVDDEGSPPRLLFEDFDGLTLDLFLRADPRLSFDDRLSILLDVGDAIAHCHRADVRHRNLSPASVLVRRAGERVEVRVHRFESAIADNPQLTVVGTSHPSAFSQSIDDLYRAPEVFQAAMDAEESSDLFSLGALAWFLFTGKHPGPSLTERGIRIKEDEGLRLWRELNGADDGLDDLIGAATRQLPVERRLEDGPLTVARFLSELRARYHAPSAVPLPDPLLADQGDLIATSEGEFEVTAVLGVGATARVLRVATPHGPAAFKLPLAPKFATHLQSEATALGRLDHEHIVRLISSPTLASPQGRITGLLLQYAGDQSLADRVRAEGSLSLDFCARLGEQLLAAVAHMHDRGVSHRDLKPANVTFASVSGQAQRLLVFDFSLTSVPRDDIGAGTRGWRDPFLGQNRWQWDDQADLYGAAATLYFALTGERPTVSNRRDDDGRVRVEANRFDANVRGALQDFFAHAFAPEVADRFRDAEAMANAWRSIFEGDTTSLMTDPREALAAADADALWRRARLDTSVAQLGLSARAVDGLERAGVFDVAALVALPQNRLSAVRGVGADTARQILDVQRHLRARLGDREDAAPEPFLGPLPGLPRLLLAADVDLPLDEAARTTLRDAGLRTTHDLALHTRRGVVGLLHLDEAGAGRLRAALRATAPADEAKGQLALWARALLSPSSESKRKAWERRVRLLTGLDPVEADPALGGCTNAAAAAALGDAPAVFRSAFHSAREHWRKERELSNTAISAVLAALESVGGVVAPLEQVAEALRAQLAPGSEADAQALKLAAALIRFATEVDIPDPPLFWQPVHGVPWVAVDAVSLPVAVQASAAVRRLIADGLPVTGDAALAAIRSHIGETALDALPPLMVLDRVVRLTPGAALSSRSEVYLDTLPAAQAIRLAAPVLIQGALSEAEVHKRVRGRFPKGEALPGRPALDLLLAPLQLQWSHDRQRYLRPDTTAASLSKTRGTLYSTASTGRPMEVEAARFRLDLQRHLESGGFCALQVSGREAEQARQLLKSQFPDLQVTSLDAAISAGVLQKVANTQGAQLEPILDLERTRTPAATFAQLLDLFLRPVLEEVVDRVLAARSEKPQLLVHPGLLARYDARKALDRLVRTAADTGTGSVWLLVPSFSDGGQPVIHHPDRVLPVPLTRASQSLRVPHRWLRAG